MFLILNVISFLGNSLAVVYLSYDGLSGCEIEHCFSMTGLAAILDSIGLPDWASKLCLPCCYYYIKSFSICFDWTWSICYPDGFFVCFFTSITDN